MYLIYLDESGNTGNNLESVDQPIHFISGIAVKTNDIQKIEIDLIKLGINFLPYSKNFDFEFHGVEIAGGKKYFRHFNIEDRLKLIDGLIKIFDKFDITFFSQGIDKKILLEKYENPYHPHYLSFMYLVEKLDRFLEINNSKGLIVMDKNIETEQKIINHFQDYKANGTYFGSHQKQITSILDTVYYTDSYNSYLMQLSDVIGYIYSIYTTSYSLGKIKDSNYVRKKLFEYYPIIKKNSFYTDIEPKKYEV